MPLGQKPELTIVKIDPINMDPAAKAKESKLSTNSNQGLVLPPAKIEQLSPFMLLAAHRGGLLPRMADSGRSSPLAE
jgi:hypothetical protein